MAKQKMYNFSFNSDFKNCDALNNIEKKILELHYDGFLQKEISFKLGMKTRAIAYYFQSLQRTFEIWEVYRKKIEFSVKLLENLKKDLEN